MADSRDITGKNRKFKGTSGIVLPKGTEAQRVDTESGELRFNTDTELMEYYDGTAWKPVDAPPTISSISTSDSTGDTTILNADGSTLYTITINGGNFSINPTVKFIGNTGTEYSAGNVTRVAGSQITCTTLSNMGTSDDPYDVQVTNASGLSATLDDAFSFNAAPVFDNPSGQIGTVYDGQTISGSTFDVSATDAEGNTITYSIVSGSLPGSGLSLSSSTGLITGTLSGTPSLGNYPFVVRASTAEGVIERQFSIQVVANPFVTASGGTETTSGGYKYHTFTSSGSFVVSYAGTGSNSIADYLIVAGGGGGGLPYGGGGGAGGLLDSTVTLSAQTYTITVGGGGSTGATGADALGGSGSNSSAFGQTATGGGGGGRYEGVNGLGGGSGGGGGGRNSGTTTGGSGTAGQGNAGGQGTGSSPIYGGGGGGGGSTGAGVNGVAGTSVNGTGGTGTNWKSLGTLYAGGGGGGNGSNGSTATTTAGLGSARGGNGANYDTPGTSGATNSGSGGGGAGGVGSGPAVGTGVGGSGGSGIVIIRYPI